MNRGSYHVPSGFVVAIIPLIIIGAPTAIARLSQEEIEISLQAGSIVCLVGEARLRTGGDGRVMCVSFLFKVKD
jgi:acyl CoA:acetate/3-ketoacid CoA transferase beta subunit